MLRRAPDPGPQPGATGRPRDAETEPLQALPGQRLIRLHFRAVAAKRNGP
jgi:hypothetical protein